LREFKENLKETFSRNSSEVGDRGDTTSEEDTEALALKHLLEEH